MRWIKKRFCNFLLLLLLISHKMFKKVIKDIMEIYIFKNAVGPGTLDEISVEMYIPQMKNLPESYSLIYTFFMFQSI